VKKALLSRKGNKPDGEDTERLTGITAGYDKDGNLKKVTQSTVDLLEGVTHPNNPNYNAKAAKEAAEQHLKHLKTKYNDADKETDLYNESKAMTRIRLNSIA